MEENVLRGNSAIVKCHIPSFVTEYVTVSSWIISEGDVDEMEIKIDEAFNLGISDLNLLIPLSFRFLLTRSLLVSLAIKKQNINEKKNRNTYDDH